MSRVCSTNGQNTQCIEDIGGRNKRKEPLGRPRHRWIDNIKIDLKEIGFEDMDWIDLAQDRD
jgi:hypothetical protein